MKRRALRITNILINQGVGFTLHDVGDDYATISFKLGDYSMSIYISDIDVINWDEQHEGGGVIEGFTNSDEFIEDFRQFLIERDNDSFVDYRSLFTKEHLLNDIRNWIAQDSSFEMKYDSETSEVTVGNTSFKIRGKYL